MLLLVSPKASNLLSTLYVSDAVLIISHVLPYLILTVKWVLLLSPTCR